MLTKNDLVKINDWLWEIPKSYRSDHLDGFGTLTAGKLGINMRVPARVYATEAMLDEILGDRSLEQLINVTTLPGIQNYALAMPDIHEGYGFPIGGVAAFSQKEGIISPGGIGYDINCGVRLLRSHKTFNEVKNYLPQLAQTLYREVPSGVGKGGRLKLKGEALDRVLEYGAQEAVKQGYGKEEDLKQQESEGRITEADSSLVSERAKSRGSDQLGTMGAGNHFVEVGVVENVFNGDEAKRLGLVKDGITILIHCGSRGLGHQIATDYIQMMVRALPKYGIVLPDRELACAPFKSKEGQDYFRAMSAGANFAWANRQLITWEVREAWKNIFGVMGDDLEIVYDVAHNIAKIETQARTNADSSADQRGLDADKRRQKVELIVHRKGATRAFPGQPVLIPGSMGTGSYLLVGQEGAMEQSFGSSCHGAGRRMSRSKAKRMIRGSELKDQLEAKGIAVAAGSMSGLAEEAPEAYKNVDEVVEVVHQAGIAKKVARFRPVAVVKG